MSTYVDAAEPTTELSLGRCTSRSRSTTKPMNESPAGAGPRAGVGAPEYAAPDADPAERSRGSTLLRVLKSTRTERPFCRFPDASQYYTSVETAIKTLSRAADRRTPGPAEPPEVGNGRAGPLDRAARARDRAAGANGGAHRPDQPEATPCGSTRKGDRTRDDLREDRPDDAVRCGRRRSAALHLTFVGTTQEPLSPASTGSTATEGAEVRGARASWQLGAPSHPTDAPRWSA